MGKARQTSNDLTLMGVIILKYKKHLNGQSVYLCRFPHNDLLWTVVKVDENGHITDAQCFMWGHNSKIKKKVQLWANRVFKDWSFK
jgi:hypothetical protein